MCFSRRRNRFCRHAGWAETLGASEQQGMTRGEKGPSRRTYSAQASAAHQGARCSGAALSTIPVRIQLHLSQEQSSSLEVQYLGDKNASLYYKYLSGLCLFATQHKLCVKGRDVCLRGHFKPFILSCFDMQETKVVITNV